MTVPVYIFLSSTTFSTSGAGNGSLQQPRVLAGLFSLLFGIFRFYSGSFAVPSSHRRAEFDPPRLRFLEINVKLLSLLPGSRERNIIL